MDRHNVPSFPGQGLQGHSSAIQAHALHAQAIQAQAIQAQAIQAQTNQAQLRQSNHGPMTASNASQQHGSCCTYWSLYANDQYHKVLSELQRANQSAEKTRSELERERQSYDDLKQQVVDMEECHYKCEQELATSKAHIEDINRYCKEVAKQAESVIDQYKARMEGVDVRDVYAGQPLGALILESAKNKHLVDTMSGSYSEHDTLMKLKYVSDQNVSLQLQIQSLTQQTADLSQETADLKKALELATEDRQSKKKTRRSQASIETE